MIRFDVPGNSVDGDFELQASTLLERLTAALCETDENLVKLSSSGSPFCCNHFYQVDHDNSYIIIYY